MLTTKDNATKTTTALTDDDGVELHVAQEVFKKTGRIIIRPYSYSQTRGVQQRKIAQIEYRGWSTIAEIPAAIRPGARFAISDKRTKAILNTLTRSLPALTGLVFTKATGTTDLTVPTATFAAPDFDKLVRAVGREIQLYDARRKAATRNGLAALSTVFKPVHTELAKGGLSHLLEPYGTDISLSEADLDRLLSLVGGQSFGKVSVTANFLRTKDKINVAYLEDVIARYEDLLKATNDNEKAWQTFFDDHGWILGNVFPYQVILNKKEAYIGGKTIDNAEGRVVDFLFQNGFRDNFALLEIKTHLTELMRPKAYREPDAFAQHDQCAGALAQCLDQKQTFMTEMGQRHPTLDPKVVLLIGRKSKLNDNQAKAFELLRRNQKNVDIVTFDELLEKIRGLRSILKM